MRLGLSSTLAGSLCSLLGNQPRGEPNDERRIAGSFGVDRHFATRVCGHVAGRWICRRGPAGVGPDDLDRYQGSRGGRGEGPDFGRARFPPTGPCRTTAGRSRSSWWCRRSSGSTSTSRTSAAGSPSWDTWRLRPSSTRGRATCRRSKTSTRSSPRSFPRFPTPRSCRTWTRRSPTPRTPARPTSPSWRSPAIAGAGESSGSTLPTIRT